MKNKILAIIPAAGIGQRFGTDKPKQYEHLNGMTVIESAVKPFLDSNLISKIIIPISKLYIQALINYKNFLLKKN